MWRPFRDVLAGLGLFSLDVEPENQPPPAPPARPSLQLLEPDVEKGQATVVVARPSAEYRQLAVRSSDVDFSTSAEVKT